MINWPKDIEYQSKKYGKWYENLIRIAQERDNIDGYKETHHIIPRSFGGNDNKSNLVHLTAREHYIAHAFLWKMKFKGVYGSKMSFAFNTFINRMRTNKAKESITYKINSRIYESFRKEYSKMLKQKYAIEGGTFLGRKHSEDTKRKIGEKSKLKEFKRGLEHPGYGKKANISPETRAKRIEEMKKKWGNSEFKAMMIEKRKTYLQTPEGKAMLESQANSRRGIKRDPAIIEKGAAKKRGKKGTELFSEQALANIREGIKNKVLTPEAKARMSFKGKGLGIPKAKTPCPHCGKLCAGNMLAKWHGDNCKLKPNLIIVV